MTATQGRAAAGNGAGEGPATGDASRERPAAEDLNPIGDESGNGDPPTSERSPTSEASPPSEASATIDGSTTSDTLAPSDTSATNVGSARNDDSATTDGSTRNDTVAAVVRQWQTVRPELDTGPMEIIGRVNRCAALLQQAEDAPLRRAGLSRPEFDLLGALRRTGHELTPGELARETFSSGAAVTKRLKQLSERGLVERRGDTRDRRVAHLRLTDAGRDLVDGILPEQLTYESAVLSALDDGRQDELADLLGELLSRLEGHMRGLRA